MAELREKIIYSIRASELRLLRCTLPSDHSPSSPEPPTGSPFAHLHRLLDQVIELIESGQYIQALSSPAVLSVFSTSQFHPQFVDSGESAHQFYSEFVPGCVASFFNDTNGDGNLEDLSLVNGFKALVVISIAVASFLAFVQCNTTGPIEKFPPMPLVALATCDGESSDSGRWLEWETWAQKELMSVGSDLRAKFSNVQYIILAKILLMSTKDLLLEGNVSSSMKSISWWLARLLLFQQKLLDDRSSTLFDLLQVYTIESLNQFGTSEKARDYWNSEISSEDALTIVSALHLEAGIMELTYGRTDSSKVHFESAAAASRLSFSLSGAMGFRTVHQVEPKAQLVLVGCTKDGEKVAQQGHELQSDASITGEDVQPPHLREMSEASDILLAPRFLEDAKTSEANCSIATTELKSVQQAVVLAQCHFIERSARSDELQKWEMAPYIEAIDSQHSSPFMIQYLCDILRIHWESTRSRTKQRSLLMMDKLVQSVCDPSPGVLQRMFFCFEVNIPTIPALRKEYGDLLVSCGLIGEAVKIYEDLELWDNLIHCYRLMEKKAAAVDLIKARLSERPSDPRLWCSLGDVTNSDSCYEKAQEVSGNKSARALRSLARSAYNRGDYEKSKALWESAMRMNSMYPDGWFALGAAALKARDVDKALDGFTRAVQLDPENGEAWNNIACLHMIKKRNKEAFIAFKEALKLKRDSWQMWENFSHVAADIGNANQALEAVQKVLDITKKKRIDNELLEKVMQDLEMRVLTTHSVSLASCNITNSADAISDVNHADKIVGSEANLACERETEHLIQLLGKILRQIVQSGGSAETWGLYARWHKLKGDLTMCSEALLKQVRSYQGSDLWKDKDRFVKFANASLELCRVYKELACRNASRRELFAAEMHLKNTIKQAEVFSDSKEYEDLQACLDEVQKALQT
ncbi:tetratricopeptide repeat protein 27 homolog [Ipomoea triloba]|uniref:tetratricopeptide repeat protein 27 homolog n=1 Tax=Ipomoea triloba TaxID=35885 RepID=UPI00125D60A6|nr:tetratricopeptide repeat protein 27 homolog [Ipomoea triloba]